MESLTYALRQLLALAALAVLCLLWGRRLMARVLDPLPAIEAGAFALGIGLGSFGTALFLLGLLGGLAPLPVGALAALSFLGTVVWRWRRGRRPGGAAERGNLTQLAAQRAAGAGIVAERGDVTERAVERGSRVGGAAERGDLPELAAQRAGGAGIVAERADVTEHVVERGGRAGRVAERGKMAACATERGDSAGFAVGPRRGSRLLLVAGVMLMLPAFVLSLYPPTAFDETTYHLPLAAAFVRAHRLVLVPEALFPVSPQLLELLFAVQLMAWGDVATHTVQLLCMGATAAALFAAGERYAGRSAGTVAAALWLANPLVHYQAASAYVDLGLTLFCLLAVLAWEHWRQTRSWHWIAAAGALAGFAAATKHLGLPWLALLALATCLAAPHRHKAAATGLYLAGAAAVLAPWVLRSLVETGNPIFPLLPDWFPGVGSPLERAAGAPLAPAWLGTSRYVGQILAPQRQLLTLLTLPWRLAFDRTGFHHQAPLAPYTLAVLPLVVWSAWRDRRLRRWLLLILGYAALGTTADPRFQLPNLALLSLAGGIAATRLAELLRSRRLRSPQSAPSAPSAPSARLAMVFTMAIALAALGPLYAAYKVWRHGPLPVTAGEREAFLLRELPGYRAIQLLNQRCGAGYTVYAFDAENLTYYARGRFLGQRSGPFAQRPLVPLLRDPDRLYQALSRWQVDDLLINHPFAAPAAATSAIASAAPSAASAASVPTVATSAGAASTTTVASATAAAQATSAAAAVIAAGAAGAPTQRAPGADPRPQVSFTYHFWPLLAPPDPELFALREEESQSARSLGPMRRPEPGCKQPE